MKIENLNLKKSIIKTLIEVKKFKEYTPIQEKIIPLAIKGDNVIGISQTGSGKSDAFLIPVVEKIDSSLNTLQTIIITPTRELATQIYNKAIDYTINEKEIRIKLLTGGFDRKREFEKHTVTPHVIIGTPARLKDLLAENAIYNVSTVKMIVIDEIDMIFDMKFLNDVDALMMKLNKNVQTLAFSATLNQQIKIFVTKYMESNHFIQISKKDKTASEVIHYALDLKGKTREELLVDVCKSLNPYLCLIFASKKEDVKKHYETLSKEGLNVGMIHGDLDARVRRQMMKRIENNEFQFIVSSDIASRGIDIEGVSQVISVDFPNNLEFYFHRAGRTGRIGNDGECYCFDDQKEKGAIKKLTAGGIDFKFADFKDGELKMIEDRKKRTTFKKEDSELSASIKKVVNQRKNAKVKPNYKKKFNAEIEKIKKDHKRKTIKASLRLSRSQKKKQGKENV